MTEILPPERQLETIAKSDLATLYAILIDHFEQGDTFTDVDLEMSNLSIPQYLTFLSNLLSKESDDHQAVYESANQAFFLAYAASDIMLPGEVRVAVGDYVDTLGNFSESDEQLCEKILNDAAEYLEDRPHLDTLITGFMPQIDKSSYNHMAVVYTVAALTFMQIEAGEQKNYELDIEAQVADFMQEIEIFT